jgi:hypothetical protein
MSHSLIRWGTNGLAFRTDGGQVYLMRSSLLSFSAASGNPPSLLALGGNAKAGGGNFMLAIRGTGFLPGAVVHWNGKERTTVFVNERELRAAIPARDIEEAGHAEISVTNPGPEKFRSIPLYLTIQ